MGTADKEVKPSSFGPTSPGGSARQPMAFWPDLLAVAGYAASTLFLFWRIVVEGMVPVGHDLFAYFYPYKAYVAEVVQRGEFPLWNPMIFMGAPLLANIQAAVLYPLDILFYLLPATDALRYSTALHVLLAAFFTYLFARVSLRLSPVSAWLAGAIFAFGGFVGARVGHPNQLHAAVWLPLLLLCLDRAVYGRSRRAAALGALAMAVQLLAGHTQEVYYSGWALGLFALYMSLFGDLHRWERLRPAAALAAMLLVGAAIAGAQLIPTLELAQESYRSGGIPFTEAVAYSVEPKGLLDSLLPLYAYAPYVEVTGYTGVLSLVLLPAALVAGRRSSYQWLLLGLVLLALVLSLGGGTRVYGWFYRLAPGFDLFRAPARWLFLYGFSVALLAGMGLDTLRSRPAGTDPRRWLERYGLWAGVAIAALVGLRFWLGGQDQELTLPHPRIVLNWWLFAAAGMVAVLLLFSRPRSRPAVGFLVALVLLELYLAADPLEYNRPTLTSLYTEPRPAYSSLVEDPSSRVLSLAKAEIALPDEGALRGRLAAFLEKGRVEDYLNYARLKEVLGPNVSMGFGIRSLDGYDGGLLPTRRYAQFKHALLQPGEYKPDLTVRAGGGQIPGSRLLGALGVSRLVVNQGAGGLGQGWEEVGMPGASAVRILRNSFALPRAYLVHRHQVVEDEKEQLELLRSADLGRLVLLDRPVDHQDPPQGGRDEVAMVRDGAGEVVVRASLEHPGFLVLSDSYYPGWMVYVDGREAELLRADYALRAVHLDAGDHEVRFSYEPRSFKLGLALSTVGLLVLLAGLLWPKASPRFR
ncbi:MAG: YfhO family protein [Chloroflexota bacterium]